MLKEKFISSDRQIAEFITALKGRQEIPLKFEYLNKGAERWDKLVRSKMYGLGKIEIDLIRNNMSKIIASFSGKEMNLMDLGCGNGMKAVPFILELLKIYQIVNYLALDISQEMIDLALVNIKKIIHGKVNLQGVVVDFEAGNFADVTRQTKKSGHPHNLLLLLGHTLGNPPDKNRLLMNIRESMTMTDFLLIGVEYLDPSKIQETVSHYKNRLIYKTQFTGLEEIGIEMTDGDFEVRYNSRKNQIETYFVFRKKRTIIFHEEEIIFRKGDKILLMLSYKFTDRIIKNLLDDTSFKVVKTFLNEQGNYVLVLCKPKHL